MPWVLLSHLSNKKSYKENLTAKFCLRFILNQFQQQGKLFLLPYTTVDAPEAFLTKYFLQRTSLFSIDLKN